MEVSKLIEENEKLKKEIEVLREENFDTVYIQAIADFKDKIREIFKKYSEKEECTYKELIDFVEEIKELLEE